MSLDIHVDSILIKSVYSRIILAFWIDLINCKTATADEETNQSDKEQGALLLMLQLLSVSCVLNVSNQKWLKQRKFAAVYLHTRVLIAFGMK